MANKDWKEIFDTFASVQNTRPHNCCVSLSCVSTVPLRSHALPLLEPKQPKSSKTIKRRALHKSLGRGYLFETQKQTISMEMQCLHAW